MLAIDISNMNNKNKYLTWIKIKASFLKNPIYFISRMKTLIIALVVWVYNKIKARKEKTP